MKTALVLHDRILAIGYPEMLADRLRIGVLEFPLATIPGYTLESVPDAAREGWERVGGNWQPIPPTQEEIDAEAAAEALRLDAQARLELLLAAKASGMFDQLKAASLAEINTWVNTNFSTLTATQRDFLKLLAAGVALYLRER